MSDPPPNVGVMRVPAGMSLEKVALHNIRFADQALSVALFSPAALGWFKAFKGRNFDDLERFLRFERLQTHVLAHKPARFNSTLQFSSSSKAGFVKPVAPVKWEAWFCCRPSPFALKEVEEYHGSYEAALKHLRHTDFVEVKSGPLTEGVPIPAGTHFVGFDREFQALTGQISHCEALYRWI